MSKTGFRTLTLVAVLLFAVVASFMLYFLSLQKKIPQALQNEFGLNIVVDDVHIGFGPKLVLTDVHIKQPQGYGEGDALFARKVIVDVDGYGRDPLIIRSIDIESLESFPMFVNGVDNFTVLQNIVNARYTPPVNGHWVTPTVMQNAQLRDVKVHINGGVGQLVDRNAQPMGTLAQPLPLKKIVGQLLYNVIDYQKNGLPHATVQDLKSKAKSIIDEGAKNIQGLIDVLSGKNTESATQTPPATELPPTADAPKLP